MPTYKFRNKNSNEEHEVVLRISELDDYKEKHPELEQMVNRFPGLSDPVRLGVRKPAAGFQDLLKNMKQKNPGSKIKLFN